MTNLVHRAVVRRVRPLSPGITRVVLGGDGLEGFVSTGVGDEYLRMWLPHEGETEPVLPEPSGAESWSFAEGVTPSPLRTYTVRDWNEQDAELTIDMVVHGHGLAARWAADAAPGDVVGVNTPRGMYSPPADMSWLLLVSDAAGLPAAARILESVPAGVRVRVVLEVPDATHELPLELPPGAELTWLHGGNGVTPSRLDEIVRAAERPGEPGYIWVAGETRIMRGVRKHLRHELGLPPTAYKVVGYWTFDNEQWEAQYEALPADVLERIRAMWADESRDEDDVEDEYDEVLERFGL